MVGLFDWLTESIGSGNGMTGGTPMQPGPGAVMGDLDPMGNPTGRSIPLPTAAPAPTGPMPDAQGPGMDAPFANEGSPAIPALGRMPPPAPPYPQGGDPMTAGGVPSNGPGLPPNMPVPTPQPRPQMPPPSAIASNPPLPPTDVSSAVRSYQAAGGNFEPPAGKEPAARSILGRAIGLDPNTESQLRGTLAGGLKAAGNSSGKSPMQAFASGAGEGLAGGKGADDKTTEQQDKYLGRKIAANAAENANLNGESTRTLNAARTKLALEQAKMTREGGYAYGGKAGTANSQQQLYLRGNALVNNDPEVKLAKSTYDNLLKQYPPDSPEVKAAAEAHKKLVEAKRTEHMGALGLKPADIEKMGKQPGMTRENPVPAAGLTKEKFDALPPGSYFINPKDNQLLVKKGPAAPAAGGNQPVAPQQSMTPAVPPVPPAVTAPAGSRADNPDE